MASECADSTVTDANPTEISDDTGKLNQQVLCEDTDDTISCRADFMDALSCTSFTAYTRPLISSPSDCSDARAISHWKHSDSLECLSGKRNSGGVTRLDNIKESLAVKRCISSVDYSLVSGRFHSSLSCAVPNTLLVGSKSSTVLRFAAKRPDPYVVPPPQCHQTTAIRPSTTSSCHYNTFEIAGGLSTKYKNTVAGIQSRLELRRAFRNLTEGFMQWKLGV